jgi:putative intracellular protease/amidase
VLRFRSSQAIAAISDANFAKKESGAALNLKFLLRASGDTDRNFKFAAPVARMPNSVKIVPRSVPGRTSRKPSAAPRRRRPVIAVLVYGGVNAFELGLATEIFGLTDMGPGWYRVVICCERPGQPVSANNGLKLVADAGLRALGAADTIIIPGWLDTGATPSASLLKALRRAHRRGARLVSICSGVFILAATGLLEGAAPPRIGRKPKTCRTDIRPSASTGTCCMSTMVTS